MNKLFVAFSAVALLITSIVTPALAAPPVHTNVGQNLNASVCNDGSSPVVNVTYHVINDADSGVDGNAWAMDSFDETVTVWPQQDGSFCAIAQYAGQFVTRDGYSPEGTGTVADGISGTIDGGYVATFTGTLAPQLSTNGNLGTFDYQCVDAYHCPGAFNWQAAFFTSTTPLNLTYWAWNYRTGTNGSWVNACDACGGNQGDITSS